MLKWSYRKYLPCRWPDASAFGGRFERYMQEVGKSLMAQKSLLDTKCSITGARDIDARTKNLDFLFGCSMLPLVIWCEAADDQRVFSPRPRYLGCDSVRDND